MSGKYRPRRARVRSEYPASPDAAALDIPSILAYAAKKCETAGNSRGRVSRLTLGRKASGSAAASRAGRDRKCRGEAGRVCALLRNAHTRRSAAASRLQRRALHLDGVVEVAVVDRIDH